MGAQLGTPPARSSIDHYEEWQNQGLECIRIYCSVGMPTCLPTDLSCFLMNVRDLDAISMVHAISILAFEGNALFVRTGYLELRGQEV